MQLLEHVEQSAKFRKRLHFNVAFKTRKKQQFCHITISKIYFVERLTIDG